MKENIEDPVTLITEIIFSFSMGHCNDPYLLPIFFKLVNPVPNLKNFYCHHKTLFIALTIVEKLFFPPPNNQTHQTTLRKR